jgi:hypothetical protein
MGLLFEQAQVVHNLSSDLQLNSDDDFTIMAWALPFGVGGDGAPFDGGAIFLVSGDAGEVIFQQVTNAGPGNEHFQVIYDFGSGELVLDAPDGSVTHDVWSHWAVRYTNSTHEMEIIKDAEGIASDTTDPGAGGDLGDELYVGATDVLAEESQHDGVLADFRIYNARALTDMEIDGCRSGLPLHADIPGEDPTLALWWQFLVEGDGVTEADMSGGRLGGTMVGNPEIFNHPSITTSRLHLAKRNRTYFLPAGFVYQQAVSRFRNDDGDLTAPL